MYLLDHYCVYLQNPLFRAVGVIKIDGLVYDVRYYVHFHSASRQDVGLAIMKGVEWNPVYIRKAGLESRTARVAD